jgi:hypothetical protein
MSEAPVVLRPHASLEIPAKFLLAEGATRLSSRLAVELEVARRIAAGLVEKGYSVSKVGPGSGGGAGFFCRWKRNCEITVHLGVERREGNTIHFQLLSWQTSSFIRHVFRGGVKPSPYCDRCWIDLCQGINNVLLNSFQATSVAWRTDEEELKKP